MCDDRRSGDKGPDIGCAIAVGEDVVQSASVSDWAWAASTPDS